MREQWEPYTWGDITKEAGEPGSGYPEATRMVRAVTDRVDAESGSLYRTLAWHLTTPRRLSIAMAYVPDLSAIVTALEEIRDKLEELKPGIPVE